MNVRITAVRSKFDAEGNELADHHEPGDYITVGYAFTVEGEDGQAWTVEREPSFEGERTAEDFADALGQAADFNFCEAQVQVKCLLDRIGGQAFLRPYLHSGQVVGMLCHYEHLVRGQTKEPDADLDNPPDLPGEDGPQSDAAGDGAASFGAPDEQGEDAADSPAETPEEMARELEAERA